tara:strand:- start:749 stop:862 length:114 start_codon:yes stop_codon:yes gene_type:complete
MDEDDTAMGQFTGSIIVPVSSRVCGDRKAARLRHVHP